MWLGVIDLRLERVNMYLRGFGLNLGEWLLVEFSLKILFGDLNWLFGIIFLWDGVCFILLFGLRVGFFIVILFF